MLEGKKVAILVAEGFEQSEMVEPRKALQQAGAETTLVSPAQDEVQGWNHYDKADRFAVDQPLDAARADDYDALLLPGGVANPDQLREEVVADHGLVSSRKPADLPAFNRKLIEEIAEPQHAA